MSYRSRRWVFTINFKDEHEDPIGDDGEQPDYEEYERSCDALQQEFQKGKMAFIIWQGEMGQESGVLHIQGYVRFSHARSLNGIKRLAPFSRAHLEAARGTEQECIDYCSKQETRVDGPYEHGERAPGAGSERGSQAAEVKLLLDAGKSLQEVADNFWTIYLRHARALQQYQSLKIQAERRTSATGLLVVLGPPGTGKTEWVLRNFPGAYWKEPNHQWFDGYIPTDHKVVVVDEFAGQIQPSAINRLVGAAPASVKVHGGMLPWRPILLVLISNLQPREWWHNTRVPLDSFYRRVDEVCIFEEIFQPAFYVNDFRDRALVNCVIKSACQMEV